MLFNSYEFLFLFFPIVLLGYFEFGKHKKINLRNVFLIIMSLVFYGWLNPPYVLIISASIVINYGLHRALLSSSFSNIRKHVLFVGVVFNVLLIGYFKYYDVGVISHDFVAL